MHAARLAAAAPLLLRQALRRGGAFADLFYEHTIKHRGVLRWEAGRWEGPHFERVVVEGAGVHVVGEAPGYAATEELRIPALRQAASEAAQQAGSGVAREPTPAQTPLLHLDLPPDAPDAVSEAEKTALLRQTVEAARGVDGRVRGVVVEWRDRVQRRFIANAEGWVGSDALASVGLRVTVLYAGYCGLVTAQAVTNGAGGIGHFLLHPPEHVAGVAVARAQHGEKQRSLSKQKTPVVLAPNAAGVWLHESVGHALEADTTGGPALGMRVAPASILIEDDATCLGGLGTFAFDDEGTLAQCTTLIEDGILHRRLNNWQWGSQCGMPCTGNARRQDYRHAPLPRMTNLYLRPGDAEPADLIAEVQDGLYVAAARHGAAYPSGHFSLDVTEAYQIESGRLSAPVGNLRIVGDGLETLSNIAGVGRDLTLDLATGDCLKAGQVVSVSVASPTVLIWAMQIR